ncbi:MULTISPECIES: hypothetical protein [Actinosynnema]|uniref:hypothetical protein n=1 Tax=Actinosynnema TaxID=40566 RepID=UPI0020A2E1B2|nr:hypothetical protein [Actinosynnema pretiosum]MCP2098849.1 hypothetical protein [Actinosynnema pretiosum]
MSLPTPLPEPHLAEDDDALIAALRTRAWDPGLRFDSAYDEVVTAYFADTPRGPLLPPVTPRSATAASATAPD